MATDSILRPGELKDLLLKEIQAADLADIDVREVGTVLEVKDGIARIYGLTSAMAGEMLEFTVSASGEKITGLALNLDDGPPDVPDVKLDRARLRLVYLQCDDAPRCDHLRQQWLQVAAATNAADIKFFDPSEGLTGIDKS